MKKNILRLNINLFILIISTTIGCTGGNTKPSTDIPVIPSLVQLEDFPKNLTPTPSKPNPTKESPVPTQTVTPTEIKPEKYYIEIADFLNKNYIEALNSMQVYEGYSNPLEAPMFGLISDEENAQLLKSTNYLLELAFAKKLHLINPSVVSNLRPYYLNEGIKVGSNYETNPGLQSPLTIDIETLKYLEDLGWVIIFPNFVGESGQIFKPYEIFGSNLLDVIYRNNASDPTEWEAGKSFEISTAYGIAFGIVDADSFYSSAAPERPWLVPTFKDGKVTVNVSFSTVMISPPSYSASALKASLSKTQVSTSFFGYALDKLIVVNSDSFAE